MGGAPRTCFSRGLISSPRSFSASCHLSQSRYNPPKTITRSSGSGRANFSRRRSRDDDDVDGDDDEPTFVSIFIVGLAPSMAKSWMCSVAMAATLNFNSAGTEISRSATSGSRCYKNVLMLICNGSQSTNDMVARTNCMVVRTSLASGGELSRSCAEPMAGHVTTSWVGCLL